MDNEGFRTLLRKGDITEYGRRECSRRWAAADAEIDRLRARNAELEKDAKRWQWGVRNARWVRHEHEAYVAIPVAVDADLSSLASRTHAVDAALATQRGGE